MAQDRRHLLPMLMAIIGTAVALMTCFKVGGLWVSPIEIENT